MTKEKATFYRKWLLDRGVFRHRGRATRPMTPSVEMTSLLHGNWLLIQSAPDVRFPSGRVAGIPGLKIETWGTLRFLPNAVNTPVD